MKYGKGKYSFKEWCMDNKKQYILDMWDYENNDKSPSEVSYRSGYKASFICSDCGNKNVKTIDKVTTRGISCKRCGDGYSYYEKFIYNVLKQLDIDFIFQLSKTTFSWCKEYKYDFYLPEYKVIIEADGEFHYNDNRMNGVKKEHIQMVDKIKDEMAIKNGIYPIRINCNIHDKNKLNYMKSALCKSALNCLFNLENIDWNDCEQKSFKSISKIISDLWNNGSDVKEICKITKLSEPPVRKYLKSMTEIGLCSYDSGEQMRIAQEKFIDVIKRKVICINDGLIFNSITECSNHYGESGIKLNPSTISGVCKGRLNTCKNLTFMYYDDYIKNGHVDKLKKYKIVQLDSDYNLVKIWDRTNYATKIFNSNIPRAIRLNIKCGGFYWMKLTDYESNNKK